MLLNLGMRRHALSYERILKTSFSSFVNLTWLCWALGAMLYVLCHGFHEKLDPYKFTEMDQELTAGVFLLFHEKFQAGIFNGVKRL